MDSEEERELANRCLDIKKQSVSEMATPQKEQQNRNLDDEEDLEYRWAISIIFTTKSNLPYI